MGQGEKCDACGQAVRMEGWNSAHAEAAPAAQSSSSEAPPLHSCCLAADRSGPV